MLIMNEFANKILIPLIRPDAETEFRIKTGTEMYRKGFCRIELVDTMGKAIPAADVRVKQTGHAFLFGCNAFMLGQFPEAEQNARYEEVFSSIFNEAVLPFYWSDLEPEDGKLRFASGSKPIYRRPPTDDVLAFCRRHNILPKGHPLCWHCFSPDWAPREPEEYMRRLERRIREIAERYADEIFLWDCVNEAQTRYPLRYRRPPFPADHVERVFHMAERYLPNARLLYNDDRCWWNFNGDYSPVYLLVSRLIEHGCRVGGLGLQYHMFPNLVKNEADQFINPRILYPVLDQFAKLQIPVNFSEVSVISSRDLGDGDRFQELAAEKLYRIWFSHPAVDGITWWNLVDGTGAYAPLGSEQGENALRAGLVNYDFTPKPAFRALQRLIREEWHTETRFDYAEEGDNVFHGFYGSYEAEIRTDAGTFHQTFRFTRDMLGPIRLVIG